MNIIDIHPHIISDNEMRYPPAPLFGHADYCDG
jgi:L-fuconolactonase